MTRQLLLCAALDLEGADPFAERWPNMVASLALGRAGHIREGRVPGGLIAAREDAATALTLGVGLGAFDLGVRLSDADNLTAGAQLSFSF